MAKKIPYLKPQAMNVHVFGSYTFTRYPGNVVMDEVLPLKVTCHDKYKFVREPGENFITIYANGKYHATVEGKAFLPLLAALQKLDKLQKKG